MTVSAGRLGKVRDCGTRVALQQGDDLLALAAAIGFNWFLGVLAHWWSPSLEAHLSLRTTLSPRF